MQAYIYSKTMCPVPDTMWTKAFHRVLRVVCLFSIHHVDLLYQFASRMACQSPCNIACNTSIFTWNFLQKNNSPVNQVLHIGRNKYILHISYQILGYSIWYGPYNISNDIGDRILDIADFNTIKHQLTPIPRFKASKWTLRVSYLTLTAWILSP